MPIDKCIMEKRREILLLAAKHGADNVRVFGSAAKGKSRAHSDLDLLIDPGPNRTPFFPGGLVADLEQLLGRKVDIVTKDALHHLIREQVIQEAVPL